MAEYYEPELIPGYGTLKLNEPTVLCDLANTLRYTPRITPVVEKVQNLLEQYGGEVPSPEKWDKLSLAEKIVGTSTASELAKMRICDIL